MDGGPVTGRPERGARSARLRPALFPALLGPAQLFLFGPFTTYSRNESELAIGFWNLAASWLWAGVLLVALLVVAGMRMPQRWFPRYVGVLFALGGMLWLQGNLLVPDFGPLYGAGVDFTPHAWRSPWETALWMLVLVVALLSARALMNVAPLFSQVLLGLQMILLVLSTTGLLQKNDNAPAQSGNRWSQPPNAIFELSRKTNVIQLVLDGFSSEIFAEAMSRDRAAFDTAFSGFVFFADHLGAFRSTRGSMPAMLGGVAYANEVPFNRFRNRVLRRGSIFNVLARGGYLIRAVTFHATEHPIGSLGGRVSRYLIPTPYADRDTYKRSAAAQVLDFTLFRHAPGALKPWIYNDDRWRLQQWSGSAAMQVRQVSHLTFLDDFTRRLAVGAGEPVYLFLHVIPPHPPIVLDSGCRLIGPQGVTRAAFAGQADCVIAHVREFFDRLRALDVYDRSAILLTADHGWALDRPGHPLKGIRTPAGPLDAIAAVAMPLLAVKAAGASGPLRTSYAPTSITDIPATIASLAGVPTHSIPGLPVSSVDAGAPRSRRFTFHSWTDADWQRRYFEALFAFDVNGRVLDPYSWKFSQTILDPTADPMTASGRLEVGLSEVERADGQPFRWGEPYAVTYAPPEARTLRVTARTDTAGPVTIDVRVNGRAIGRLQLTGGAWRTLTHPLEARQDSRVPFCIELVAHGLGKGATESVQRLRYRASFWTR